MKWKNVSAALMLAVLVTACSGVKTTLDYDPTLDFSTFKTYSWIDTDGQSNDAFAHERILRAIDTTLQARGLELVESGGDFAVGYQVTTEQRSSYTTVSAGWGGYGWGRRGWRGGSMGVSTAHTTENISNVGTLILALFDGETKDLAWTGTATDTINPNRTPQERQEAITDAVDKMMHDFPPGT